MGATAEVLASWVGTFHEPRCTGEEVEDRYRLRQAEPA